VIYPLMYALVCDICKNHGGEHENSFILERDAEANGWQFRRRKDGQRAGRGGKDYCPDCVPSAWAAS
jgi:hypothetical protein